MLNFCKTYISSCSHLSKLDYQLMSLLKAQHPATIGYRYSRFDDGAKPTSPNPKPSWRSATSLELRKRLRKLGKQRRVMTSKETFSLSRQPLEDRVSSAATELSAECLKSLQRRPSDGSSTKGELEDINDGSRKYVPSVEDGSAESFQIDSKLKHLHSGSSRMQHSLESAHTRKEMDLQVRSTVSPVHWGTRLRNLQDIALPFHMEDDPQRPSFAASIRLR